MGRLTRRIRWLVRRLADTRGISLYETTAVIAMTAIVASVAFPMVSDHVENSKSVAAVKEVSTIRDAIQKFFQDTSRVPGEVEIRRAGSTICFLQTGVPATDPTKGTPLPEITNLGLPGLPIDASTVLGRPCNTITTDNVLNINNFLVLKPSEVAYPNWKGPYMEPIAADRWDRAYIINVLPLIFATAVDDPGLDKFSETGGKLGFGWVITAGPDRLLQTPLTLPRIVGTSDDTGANLGARIVKSAGGGSAPSQ